MYNDFASVYDLLMDDVNYDEWAAYYLQLLELPPAARVCECACGTGSMSVRFARAGLKLTGVDLSEQMLRVAGEKARKNGVRIIFVCQDMRKLTLPRRQDAILATCDGVNYLTGEADAAQFFAAAYDALKPGGRLVFDISSQAKLERTLGNAFFGEERDDIAYLWQNTFDEKKRTVQMDVTFFVREADGRYRRFDEVHVQRAYALEEVIDTLKRAGFEDIHAYGQHTMEEPRQGDSRIHFYATKPMK